uniref:Saposin B-type domain-containing protein n=1 Tax=Rhabditophanes sp. KR3021 TaxID=114890 RepID=A0AC35TKU8_9BILA
MSKFVIILALTILCVANIYASIDCDICHQIIQTAESHFKKGEPESTLLGDLVAQCKVIGATYGQQATSVCLKTVQQNINKIYQHFNDGMTPCTFCRAAQSCTTADTCVDSFLKL